MSEIDSRPDTKNILQEKRIAVILPCFNEEITVARVVREFKEALPSALVYVFDNNSTDKTAELAEKAGAIVVRSPRQGKGNVVRHMFDEVGADIYIMCDGDDTYPVGAVHNLIELLDSSRADMVVGLRESYASSSPRRFHAFGNRLVAMLISKLFNTKLTDILSGYRIFSNDFVESVSLTSTGFEIETELTLQALSRNLIIKELPVQYTQRPAGSTSKLNTFSDGYRILKSILILFKDYKPLIFFSGISFLLLMATALAGIFPVLDYLRFQYVYHIPLAVLAAGLGILSTLTFSVGLILDTVLKYHKESAESFRRVLRQKNKYYRNEEK